MNEDKIKNDYKTIRNKILGLLTGKHEIEIWGDGNQTRSFMYIDDCLEGIEMIMHSDVETPLNLGSNELVTINELVDLVEDIVGVKLHRKYKLDAPKGVNGRNSDNTEIHKRLGWEPGIRLRDGMEKTCAWIREQYQARYGPATAAAASALAPISGAPAPQLPVPSSHPAMGD